MKPSVVGSLQGVYFCEHPFVQYITTMPPITGKLRPISCQVGTLQAANGSALWTSGNTQVLAALHGPITPRQPQHDDTTVLSILIEGTTEMREYQVWLNNVLRPQIIMTQQNQQQSVIQITLHIINSTDSGIAVLAACLHASVASLLDAGIAMFRIPCATSFGIINDNWIIDASDSKLVMVSSENSKSGKNTILACHSEGIKTKAADLLQAMQVLPAAVKAIHAVLRLVVEQKEKRQAMSCLN